MAKKPISHKVALRYAQRIVEHERAGIREKNPRYCHAVIDYGIDALEKIGFRYAVQVLPEPRPVQVPKGVQILVKGMTKPAARALADHLNAQWRRERRGNPAVLRRGRVRAFFQGRRKNPTLAVMGANPPAAEEIEATWAFLQYRRPDDPDGKRIIREHEFEDGFIAIPMEDGSIVLRHPQGLNLWTRR